MVSFEEIQTVYYMVAATGVIVAAVYYVLNMRANLQTRQAQLFMQIYNRVDDKELYPILYEVLSWSWTDFDDFYDKYGPETNPEVYSRFTKLVTFFEGVGVLVKEDLVSIRLVALLMTGLTNRFWEKVEPIIADWRVKKNYPRLMSESEYLYKELLKYSEKHPELKS